MLNDRDVWSRRSVAAGSSTKLAPLCHPSAVGGLDAKITDMEARGYRVISRGTHAAVLTRDSNRSRTPLRIVGLIVSAALGVFGVWRGSWAFALVGVIAVALIGGDWWLQRRSMTVRLTVDDQGRVRKELIKLGDA